MCDGALCASMLYTYIYYMTFPIPFPFGLVYKSTRLIEFSVSQHGLVLDLVGRCIRRQLGSSWRSFFSVGVDGNVRRATGVGRP